MNDRIEENTEELEVKPSSTWALIPLVIICLVMIKVLGFIGALVTFGTYYWLKPKIGALGGIILSAVLGLVSGLVVAFLILNLGK